MQEFTATECITFGWETFAKKPGLFIGALLLIALAEILLWILGLIPLLGAIASLCGGILISMGVTRFFLGAHDDIATASIEKLWNPHPFWTYIGAGMLRGLIMIGPLFGIIIIYGVSLLLLNVFSVNGPVAPTVNVVVGFVIGIWILASVIWMVYISIRLMFMSYLVIDKQRSATEALKESGRCTKGIWWKLFLLGLLLIVINILGALAILIGLLISIPVSKLAVTRAYRLLEHRANEVVPVGSAA